jgi:Protein of unknown function VcgC/VcgE (DUF2780)
MKISRAVALTTFMTVAASPVFAFNLNDATDAVKSATGGTGTAATTPQASGLLGSLTSKLNVSPEQAVGGTGAMMGLAKNKLSSGDYSSLTKSVPGLDKLSGAGALSGMMGGSGSSATSAVSNVKSMGDVNNAFGKLGMDSGMAGKFAPVIMDYLGKQGASGSVLKSLGSIWGVGG